MSHLHHTFCMYVHALVGRTICRAGAFAPEPCNDHAGLAALSILLVTAACTSIALRPRRYGIGQFYKVHADTLRDEQAGPRVSQGLMATQPLHALGRH
jgi:hypothetical protein